MTSEIRTHTLSDQPEMTLHSFSSLLTTRRSQLLNYLRLLVPTYRGTIGRNVNGIQEEYFMMHL
jgi:hypothetical protein